MTIPSRHVLLPLALLAMAASARGETISGADRALFENKIRPVLARHCYQCHSAESKELGGSLLLDSRQGVLEGGQSGPAVAPGKPEASLIVQALRYDGLEMPPQQPLPEAVVNDFARWVRRGAPDPRTDEPQASKGGEQESLDRDALWSFLPRQAAPLPAVADASWPRDPLDHFILARIEARGLRPAADADSRTLVRRLHYDLTGLPPTLAEIEAFAEAHRRDGPAAVERLVDRLLERPQFGEKWGRHWLDVARYGESNGDDGLGRNATFPHAWRYRDYVIDAVNRDVPYDRFLTEQIAGDLLPADSAEQRNRQLVATGFLAIGAKPASAMNKNFAMDVVDDQIDAVSTAVMGLSVACARCHDHKHDPIPTRDYYALAGFFSSTETLYGLAANEKLTAPPTELHELRSSYEPERAGKPPAAAPDFPDSYSTAIEALGPQLHAALDVAPQGLTVQGDAKFSAEQFGRVRSASIDGRLEGGGESYSVSFWFKNEMQNNARPITAYLLSRAAVGDKALPGDHLGIGGTHDKARSGKLFVFNGNAEKKSLAGSTVVAPGRWHHVLLVRDGGRVRVHLNGSPRPEIDGELPPTFGDSADFRLAGRSDDFAPLQGNVAELAVFSRPLSEQEAARLHEASGQPPAAATLGLAMGVRDKAKPADCKIHVGGETGKLGPVVPRGFLTAYRQLAAGGEGDEPLPLNLEPKQSGRLQLAAWLTRPDHPQTARVMANRVWLHLMGRGIVSTPDDFGVYGSRPTHPQLLDHLADRFVADGWSLKRLIRAIVLSRAYQLDSRCPPELAAADPDNRLQARHSRRRLQAEELRDSVLLASGQLDLTPGEGSAVETVDALINWPPGEATDLHRPSRRRSVYLCMLRHAPPPQLAPFGLPDGIDSVSQRDVSVLPTQSLFLLNGPLVIEQSQALARDVLAADELDDDARIRRIFRQSLQRDPRDAETKRCLELVRGTESELKSQAPDGGQRRLKAWASLCQALLATNEFRHVD